ncbi:hypothetical protein M407DRAFT_34737 [Tulasnella calospora MUT 4182]|uniref:F-box domain-containing protein n=1 Tax=Tulasnella calospora MUT 4182 TaxID=1051891 RepID=A0A0C3Q0V2_9AGAM|nr:hypothetical protein M407DRAFT_34737 [Tulasnella calospora MUT 4182]
MDRLPTEIFSFIYFALLPIPPCTFHFQFVYPTRDRMRALERLRLVSKQWNNAVLGTPELWSYIEVSNDWSIVDPLLARAKAVPLHVRIALNPFEQLEPRFERIVETVWSTANRWDTYVSSAFIFGGWFNLLPPTPLHNVREVWLSGSSAFGPPKLRAPRIEKLVENFCAPIIEDIGVAGLRSWGTSLPLQMSEWERFMTITQQCPALGSLRFMSNRHDPRVLEFSGFTKSYNSLVLPSLTELVIRTDAGTFTLLPYIRAPRLELLIIEDYSSFIPFSIPCPSSCPALRRIRFIGGGTLQTIQAFLATVPKEQIEKVTTEIEYSKFAENIGGFQPGTEGLAERRKWINEKFRVRWILTYTQSS